MQPTNNVHRDDDHPAIRVPRAVSLIIRDLFTASLGTYLMLYLVDKTVQGFVSDNLTMNVLLAVVVVSGVLMGLLSERSHLAEKSRTIDFTAHLIYAVGVGLLVGVAAYVAAGKLGWIRIAIAVFSAVATAGMLWTLTFESTRNDSED